MLTEVILENFKIFSKVRLNTRQITILTGPNSSGKSTIIQALMLIKQMQNNSELVLSGSYIKMDDIEDIIRSEGKILSIGFSGEEAIIRNINNKQKSEEVYFTVEANFSGINIQNMNSELEFERDFVEGEFRNRKQVSNEQSVEYGKGRILIQPQLSMYQLFQTSGYTGTVNQDEIDEEMKYLNYVFGAPQRLFESIEFIPANRGFSLPGYSLDNKAIDHFFLTKPMEEYERDMATTMAYRRDELEEVVSDWMSEITGIRVKAPVRESKLVQILARQAKVKNPKDVKIAFEGYGSNQLLFILVPLAQSLDNSILVIEEPELHLHPKAQASLTRRLLKESKEHKKQIITTTHSEHVIASILTSIASDMFDTEDIAIYYLKKRGQMANAKLLKLMIKEG